MENDDPTKGIPVTGDPPTWAKILGALVLLIVFVAWGVPLMIILMRALWILITNLWEFALR